MTTSPESVSPVSESPVRHQIPETAPEAAGAQTLTEHGASRSRSSSVITCGGCPARWTGLAVAHCAGCHETFSALGLFDRHRTAVGERGACKPPAELSDCEFRDGMWRGPRYDGFGGLS